MSKVRVFVATPTMGTVVDSQAYLMRDLQDIYGHLVEFIYPQNCVRRMFHDHARNKMVEEFLGSEADIIWFLDSDITPPINVLDLVTIHKDKWEIAGATYPVFMCPDRNQGPELQVVYTAYAKNESGTMGLSDVPQTGQKFIDGLATGCLFIKRSLFAKLEKPYFEFKYDKDSRDIVEGEDIGFCFKVNKLGVKFFTDFAMVCKHQKSVDLLDVNNYAISYSNKSVLNYDKIVQQQIKDTINEAYQRGVKAGRAQKSEAAQPKSSVIWTP